MDLIKIVIIEDSTAYRQALEVAIQKDPGMNLIASFGMAERALRFIKKAPSDQTPDIVLLDLQLPGISGLEVLPLLKKEQPDLKVIILTQSEKQEDFLEAMAHDVSSYLLKSTSSHQVINAITTTHQGNAILDLKSAKVLSHKLREISLNHQDPTLSTREIQVLERLALGHPKKQISTELGISTSTIVSHTISIYRKLGATNAPSAIAQAYTRGILKID